MKNENLNTTYMYMYQMAIRIVTGVHIMSDIYMYIGYDV